MTDIKDIPTEDKEHPTKNLEEELKKADDRDNKAYVSLKQELSIIASSNELPLCFSKRYDFYVINEDNILIRIENCIVYKTLAFSVMLLANVLCKNPMTYFIEYSKIHHYNEMPNDDNIVE